MNIRVIKIYTTLGVSAPIETNVTTLGELKPLLRNKGIEVESMKLLVGETRNELSVDEAVLPEGDFKLYLMPQKTKSGNISDVSSLFSQIAGLFEELADEIHSIRQEQSNSSVKPSYRNEDEEAMDDLKKLNRQ